MAVFKTSTHNVPAVNEPVPRQLISALQPYTLLTSLCCNSNNNNNNIHQSSSANVTTVTASTDCNYKNVDSPSSSAAAAMWLQAMRDVSPPRRLCCQQPPPALLASSDNHADESISQSYTAWMVKHPSALHTFEEHMEAAKGKQIAIFLDYDGTLSPIVDDPERAIMTDEMRAVVKDIATLFPTSIITGRSREKVFEFVQLGELYYAGSHGMDIMGPALQSSGSDGSFQPPRRGGCITTAANGKEVDGMVLFQPATEFTSIMDEVFNVLEEQTRNISGATVEHNKFCISVHFRRVKEENWLTLAQKVQHVLNSYPNLRLTHGRKILEIRPSIAWNKGKALDFLMQALGLGNPNDVFPVYVGDDRTDEDAFKVITGHKHGLSILVSRVPKKTDAMCSLRDPTEVLAFLQYLVKWQRRRTK